MTLKKGDKVRIKKSSDFIHQNKGIGRITNIPEIISNIGWVKVKFEDGYDNSYPIRDLDLVKELKEPKIFIFRK